MLRKWGIGVLVLLSILIAAYFLLAARTDTYLGRFMAWKWSDIGDYRNFPSREVRKAPPVFNFTQAEHPPDFSSVTYTYRGRELTTSLANLLEASGTTAFIITQGDSLLYEGYFNGYGRDSVNTSFSVAKSITSLLAGAALDEGSFASLQDPITDYLPELAETDERYRQITLEHLLSMKSGIAYQDHDLPWGDKPKAYYHPQLRELVTSRPVSEPPGQRWGYNTYNPILLGIALEHATGKSVPAYFEEKLWSRLGMEFDGSWSIDSEDDNLAKMESGINLRAIDMVKFGRLVLDNGSWNGQQVLSEEWIAQSIRIDPASHVPEIGSNIYYQYGWWIHAPNETQAYAVGGWGHLGQYLYIFPDKDVVMVRFGSRIGEVDAWPRIFQELARQID